MGLEAWVTLGIVIALLAALIWNLAPPDLLFIGATSLLAVLGIISPDEAFSGFANAGMLTVAALFIVAAALRDTGLLDYVGHHVLGKAKTENQALGRLAVFVLPMSAFLNNTPIVAMFMPVVIDWCRRNQVSASKLLIPLSYLTILGGTCTLIGTSTNLVVDGLMIKTQAELVAAAGPNPTEYEQKFNHGLRGMSLFEISKAGIPYAMVGLIYMFLVGKKLLPERKELMEQLGESRREYLLEMLVLPQCRLVGQTVEAAGLRNLPGLFLIEIDREGTLIGPVGPRKVIEANDRLVFTGVVKSIVELEKIGGLVPIADPSYEVTPSRQRERTLVEAVISNTSPLVGKTIRESDFRATYGAAVVAVHRNGTRVSNKVGDIVLRPGDTLLLQTGTHFMRAHRNDPAFHLVSSVQEWRALRRDRAWIAAILFAVLLVLMTTGWVPVLVAAMGVAALMVFFGCISAGDARQSIEWQVLVTIAASFGVGAALENSGAASTIAGGLVEVSRVGGPTLAFVVLYFAAMVLTEMITNNAAAVLIFPFCLETAKIMGVDPRPFLMGLVLAASASFATPVGYATNMMVYGPGGYRFMDFIRAGAPMNILMWIVASILVPIIWPF